jgi:hypothetical protein
MVKPACTRTFASCHFVARRGVSCHTGFFHDPQEPVMAKKKAAKKKIAAKKPAKKAAKKKIARKKPASLGRPVVTAEELLYMLFKDDYHARQIFEFLRVETVGELEHYSPQEIVNRLSRPVVESVDRIRRTLAEKNRCLAGDIDFALQHKAARTAEGN